MQTLLPQGWKRPKGYANGVAAEGRFVLTAGIVGWDEHEVFHSDAFIDQVRQVLANTLAILAEAGAEPQHVAQMTWYVTDLEEYRQSLKDMGPVWREYMGANYPAIACVEVSGLVEKRAKLEVFTIAVVPAR